MVCEKFGVQPEEVEETLEGGDYQSHLAIAYRLIVDNKHMEEKHAIEEFKEFMSAPVVSGGSGGTSTGSDSSGVTVKPHPERIAPLVEVVQQVEGKKPHTEKTHLGNPIKRAKWHLGIRSQSRPQDIMNEVYRAMKTLDYEWKVINPYHVHVRRRRSQMSEHFIKMSLQLYQVDYKSFLLDFKSLLKAEEEEGENGERKTSVKEEEKAGEKKDDDDVKEAKEEDSLSPKTESGVDAQLTGHQTMEFFEMCAALITQLAR